jgi:molybdenum cofactor sulfurtransferase
MMPNTLIEHAATSQSISLRTGCMCNPGGAAALLGAESEMEKLYEGVTMDAYEAHAGREMGVVRISLGIASSFRDIWKVARFAATLGNDEFRRALWDRWKGDSARGHGH